MAVDKIEGWSEAVEDLVEKGEVDGAISLLESVVSKLETLTVSSSDSIIHLQISTALADLANLQSSKNLSLKNAEKLCSRPGESGSNASSSNRRRDDEEDWESIADLGVSTQGFKGGLADSVRVDEASASRRRRGRGSFLYMKDELYCDRVDDGTVADYNSSSGDEDGNALEDESGTVRNSTYGTGHVIVLYDFSPSTRTTQLEIFFDKFRERGFAIRWVNDTVALAVFRTPSSANEARSSIHFPFKVRPLEEDDAILTQISPKDLEPPIVRPKTSARTAQRLIAHAMGIEPSNSPGSDEFRKQEEARKNRIHERQNMKNDAWGSD